RLFILIREDFLTLLSPGHTILLLLTEFRGSELLLLLATPNLVTHGIKDILLICLVLKTRTSTLTLNPIVARRCHFSVKNRPTIKHISL
ncbi:hypothetical protein L873DRAFT_1702814, partial [Choiromyces venosus 120613-1]